MDAATQMALRRNIGNSTAMLSTGEHIRSYDANSNNSNSNQNQSNNANSSRAFRNNLTPNLMTADDIPSTTPLLSPTLPSPSVDALVTRLTRKAIVTFTDPNNTVAKREKIAAVINKLTNPPTEQLISLFNTCVGDSSLNSQTIFDLIFMMSEFET